MGLKATKRGTGWPFRALGDENRQRAGNQPRALA